MQTELKPCPFCGGHTQPVYVDPADGISGIYCHGCRALVKWNIEMEPRENYGENYQKWARKWNRRANDDQGADGRKDHANTAGD